MTPSRKPLLRYSPYRPFHTSIIPVGTKSSVLPFSSRVDTRTLTIHHRGERSRSRRALNDLTPLVFSSSEDTCRTQNHYHASLYAVLCHSMKPLGHTAALLEAYDSCVHRNLTTKHLPLSAHIIMLRRYMDPEELTSRLPSSETIIPVVDKFVRVVA